ncbi:MAG TPA: hypothetical protein VJ870_06305 [Amycolatopsis sp.]|nr:hypothetical protein [Amycolatopsis sp.]
MINQLIAATGWKPARTGHVVTFTAPAGDHPWPLLVWPGHGLGLPGTSLRAFYDAIADLRHLRIRIAAHLGQSGRL